MPANVIKILDTLNKKQLEVILITLSIVFAAGWTLYDRQDKKIDDIAERQIRLEATFSNIGAQVSAIHDHFFKKGLEDNQANSSSFNTGAIRESD